MVEQGSSSQLPPCFPPHKVPGQLERPELAAKTWGLTILLLHSSIRISMFFLSTREIGGTLFWMKYTYFTTRFGSCQTSFMKRGKTILAFLSVTVVEVKMKPGVEEAFVFVHVVLSKHISTS